MVIRFNSKFSLLIFNLLFFFQLFGQDPKLVTIGGITKNLSDATQCEPKEWGEKEINVCSCCLIKYKSKWPNKKANEIISYCIKKTKKCNQSLINAIKIKENLKGKSDQEFLTAIYNKSLVIHRLNFDEKFLGPDGKFSEQSLAKFLVQAYKENKYRYPQVAQYFKREDCLKVKDLGIPSGYQTTQLFTVDSTCQPEKTRFIIKGLRKQTAEPANLEKIANYPGMKELILPNQIPDLPSLALPTAYFEYPYHNKFYYIAKMPAAKGKPIASYMLDYKNNTSNENKEKIQNMFHVLGKEVANFHKRFMLPEGNKKIGKSIIHADFHAHNIFYDEDTKHVTFIDNETMEKSLNNRTNPNIDYMQLFYMPFSFDDQGQFSSLLQGVNKKEWHEISLKPFIEGYLEAYPENKKQVLQELKTIFNEGYQAAHIRFNYQQLIDLRKNYINPIFDELMKKY